MTLTPTLSPWPAPTAADAATSCPPAPVLPTIEAPQRRPVAALIETVRRLTSPSERAEHAALKEEQHSRADPLDLPGGWCVLHATDIPAVRELDAGADHVAVGPGGVFFIYPEHHLGPKVWSSEHR